MTDREQWIQTVIDRPDYRPIFADWLDEYDEPELAVIMRKPVWTHTGLDTLAGRTISRVLIGERERRLVIEVNHERMVCDARGDCCSTSWFYRLRGVSNLIGHRVIGFYEADTADVDPNDGLGRQEEDSVYGIGIITEVGACEIIFRCSSNGYYGGWLELREEKDWYDEDDKDQERHWEMIRDDWTYEPSVAS